MEFENSFLVDRPLPGAWRLLLDVPAIASCMPGATLGEVLGPDHYRGSVAIRLGPVALSFLGAARVEHRDEANSVAIVKATGSDAKGRGGAQATVHFRLRPDASGTRVHVHTDLQLSGSVAQYGRASGLIADLAEQLIRQFERNLAERLAANAGDRNAGGAADPGPAHPVKLHVIGLKALWKRVLRWLSGVRANTGGTRADREDSV